MYHIKIEEPINNNDYTHYVGIQFENAQRAYFFGIKEIQLNLDDVVVVETTRGLELGKVASGPFPMENYESELGLKPVIRIATEIDLKMAQNNKKDAVFALDICKKEIENLKLDMNLISCEYTLDKGKVIFSYLADDRVDFRELLKILASKLHTRIELRQIGSRDKAKMVGGLGICGLPLCCSSFLNEFDGISINRAKNQMLAINIPKLTGQCGKLICCLKYEDDAYTDLHKAYPDLGTKVILEDVNYVITSINLITGIVKIESEEDIKFVPFQDLKKNAKILFNKKENGKEK